jgi:hypothetical protein
LCKAALPQTGNGEAGSGQCAACLRAQSLRPIERSFSIFPRAPQNYNSKTKLHPLILEAIDLLLKKRSAPSIEKLTRKAVVVL